MAITPSLAPCLVTLRNQFNSLNPARDKESDGWIGNAEHRKRQSDHNPDSRGIVHAIDVTASGPWPRTLSMAVIVTHIVDSHRVGADNRLKYVIYKRKIAGASNGWRWETYTGTNPHDKHAHFSCEHKASTELDTRNFALEGIDMAELTPAQVAAHDIDSSAGTQSWGGAAWTTLLRTGYLANTWAPATTTLIENLRARVEDQGDDLDALGASLVLITAGLNQVLADPAEAGEEHPLVKAFRYVQAHPTPGA